MFVDVLEFCFCQSWFHAVSSSSFLQSFSELLEFFFTATQQIDVVSKLQSLCDSLRDRQLLEVFSHWQNRPIRRSSYDTCCNRIWRMALGEKTSNSHETKRKLKLIRGTSGGTRWAGRACDIRDPSSESSRFTIAHEKLASLALWTSSVIEILEAGINRISQKMLSYSPYIDNTTCHFYTISILILEIMAFKD